MNHLRNARSVILNTCVALYCLNIQMSFSQPRLDGTPSVKVIALDASFDSVISEFPVVEPIANDALWAEGPVCLQDKTFVWSDVKANKAMSWRKGEEPKTWLDPSDFQNGRAIDLDGREIAASHGKRAIVRKDLDGLWRTLIGTYQGKRFNSPNDVVVDRYGAIWFSDPTFGLLSKDQSYGGIPEQDGEFVYRYDPTSHVVFRLNTPEIHSPNGLAFSPDGAVLYIADSQLAHNFQDKRLAHRIVAYSVKDGALYDGRIFATVSPGIPDGLKVDSVGNVWSTSKEGLQIFSAKGRLIGKILVGSTDTGNLNFCSDNGRHWLYVAAANHVLRVETRVGGAVQVPTSR